MALGSSSPDIASLEMFVDAIYRGSISAAAVAARVSQPTASERIRKLERQLGAVLVERTTSGVQPTAVGRVVLAWATDVIEAMDRLKAGVRTLDAGPDASLHVAASFTIAELLLPTWLARLRVLDPHIKTMLDVKNSAEVESMVESSAVHLGFIEGPRVCRPLRRSILGDDELVVVVGRGHRWARRRSDLSVEELISEPLVLREPGSGTRDALVSALHDVGASDPVITMEAGSLTSVLRAVMDGVGPTVISTRAVEADIAAGRLFAVRVAGLKLRRHFRAVWNKSGDMPLSASALLRIARTSGLGGDA